MLPAVEARIAGLSAYKRNNHFDLRRKSKFIKTKLLRKEKRDLERSKRRARKTAMRSRRGRRPSSLLSVSTVKKFILTEKASCLISFKSRSSWSQ